MGRGLLLERRGGGRGRGQEQRAGQGVVKGRGRCQATPGALQAAWALRRASCPDPRPDSVPTPP